MKSTLLRGAAAATAAVLIAGGGATVASASPGPRLAAAAPDCSTSPLSLGNVNSLLTALGSLGQGLSLSQLLDLVTGLSRTECTGLPTGDVLDLAGLGLDLDDVLGVLQPGTHLLGLTPVSADVDSPLVGLVVVAGITDAGDGTLDVLVNGEPVIEGIPLVNLAGIGVGANLSLLPSLVGNGTVTVRYNGTVSGGGTTSNGIAVNAGLLTSTFSAASATSVTYPAKSTVSFAVTGPTVDPLSVKNPIIDLNNLTGVTDLVVTPVEPQGTVTAKVGSTTVGSGALGADGTGSFPLNSSMPGSQAVTLTYQPSGTSTLLHSGSSTTTTAVTAKATSARSAASTASTYPAGPRATVTLGGVSGGAKPTGTVAFSYLGGAIGTATVNSAGVASLNLPGGWVPGSRTITYRYSGDTRYVAASGSVTATNAKGSTSVSATGNSVPYGRFNAVSITARGAGIAPSGTLSVNSPATRYALTNLVGGRNPSLALVKYLPVGTHTLSVKYYGNSYYTGSTTTVKVTVTKAAPKVAVSVDTRTYPGKVVLRAKFSPTLTMTPTGTVQAVRGGAVVGSGSVRAGAGAVDLGRLPRGTFSYTLRYSGDGTFSTVSVPVTVTVR